MKDDVRPKPAPHSRPQESLVLLKKEMKRRGMTPEDVEKTLRKKRRRKNLEFDLVISKRAIPPDKRLPAPRESKAQARDKRLSASRDICTVDVAADLLSLHPKTVLRLIKSGKLPAVRLGKAYRIKRSDLEEFAGIPAPSASASQRPRVTTIVDIPNVGPPQARKWSSTIAAETRRLTNVTADVAHDSERRQLKVVMTGAPEDVQRVMAAIQGWLSELS